MPRIANSTRFVHAVDKLRSLASEVLNCDVQIVLVPSGPPKKRTRKPKKNVDELGRELDEDGIPVDHPIYGRREQ